MPVIGLHHVRFTVKDLEQQEEFALHFGLVVESRSSGRLVMRTRGGDKTAYVAELGDSNRFVGLAFEVDSEVDLDEAVARHGAAPPAELELPCGGRCVSLRDPDGNHVWLVHGTTRQDPEAPYPELLINTPFAKHRFGRNQSARERGPAQLWRIGHVGLFVRDFAASTRWYAEHLGLIGSDVYHVPGVPEAKIVGFFRLNRGDEYVDHHVVAFMQDDRGGCHHISFEAQDFEAQQRTHRYLGAQNYESIWGVGRHPHGSHVFDVWRAPDGARFETFSDTDLFRASDGTRVHDISTVVMDEWSDDAPTRYFA